jgi:hypothetical protein
VTGRRFARQYDHLIYDAEVDAFLDVWTRPDKIDPGRAPAPEADLLYAARCNVSSAITSERRLKARERQFARNNPEIRVALDPAAQNTLQEDGRRLAADLEEILTALNSRDRQIFQMSLDGVRNAGAFAKLLHIEHLPLDQQRQQIKRHKNRIRGFLKRKGLLP